MFSDGVGGSAPGVNGAGLLREKSVSKVDRATADDEMRILTI
jgi:hypothetical protein